MSKLLNTLIGIGVLILYVVVLNLHPTMWEAPWHPLNILCYCGIATILFVLIVA